MGTCAAGFASLAAVSQAHAQAGPNQWGLNLIQAPAAWALGYTGANVAVAVADSGIDFNHTALANQIDPLNRSRNFQLPAAGAAYDPNQIGDLANNGHGTHVGGIIAGAAGSGATGVAYDSRLVVLRILNGSTVPSIGDQFVAAVNYFAGLSNVTIYNASYGPDFSQRGGQRFWPADTISQSEANAVFTALSRGKIIVAATGNDRDTSPVAGQQPSGIPLYPYIQPFHASTGVYSDGGANFNFSPLLNQTGTIVAVTAVGLDKTIASYAQFCGVTASWCLAAPGGNPPAPGDLGIWSTLPGNNFGYSPGTSMAAPMVSGALAVLQGAYGGYNAQDLTHVLYSTAENVGGQLGVNSIYGYGMIRLDRATAGPTALAANSVQNVAAQQMVYYSQPLTVAGDFGKTGDGYLMIAGRTAVNGNVNVFGGALGVGGTLTLANNAQVNVAQGAALTGIGAIVGNVAVAGTLNAGQLPNYADFLANGGVQANIPSGLTSPGTLTIQGNVQLGAAAFHRVNIDGTLLIPGGPGTYDKIIVTGAGSTFVAGGTVVAVMRGIPGGYNTFTPRVGTQLPFVQAQNGAQIAGQYSSLNATAGLDPNTRFDLRYTSTSIAFAVTPLTFTNFVAQQPTNTNQQHMAAVFDHIRPAAGARSTAGSSAAMNSAEDALFNLLYSEDSDGDLAALAALSGQGHAATPGVVMNTLSGLNGVIADRQGMMMMGAGNAQAAAGAQASLTPSVALAYASGGTDVQTRLAAAQFPYARTASAPVATGQWMLWGQTFGRFSRVGERDGLPGYKASSGGFVLGADWLSGSNWTFGGAFGYARTTTTSFETTARTDTYSGALYASWTPGALVFDARIAAGPATTSTTRSIVFPGESITATAGIKGWGGIVAGEAGYRFNVADVTLKPYVGLSAQVFRQASFTETSDVGLTVPAQTFQKLTSAVGVWASTTMQHRGITYMPQARLAWTRDLRDNSLTSQAALFEQSFTIDAAAPGRDAALVSLNLTAWRTQSLSVYAGYTGEFRINAVSHQIAGGFRAAY